MMTSSNGNIFRVTGLLCGNRGPVNSPHKGQWRRALMFSLICAWINDWANNREAGDLRRYRAHYDVIQMLLPIRHLGTNFSKIWIMIQNFSGDIVTTKDLTDIAIVIFTGHTSYRRAEVLFLICLSDRMCDFTHLSQGDVVLPQNL